VLDTTHLSLSRSKKKIKLDTLLRQNHAHFLRTQNATKTLPFGNVKASAKSSHHEDFADVLTFGWFGGAFFIMGAQKSAIMADPISTFYKVDIGCS